MSPSFEFDKFASDYENTLNRGIGVSGESSDFFVRGRLDWLLHCLAEFGSRPKRIMDYGCGTGATTQALLRQFGAQSVIGVEVSAESLTIARGRFATNEIIFRALKEYMPAEDLDLVYCNGVFHHIPPADRPAALQYIYRSLRPQGCFALWENNPWNPGTHYVMWRIPFDKNAIKLSSAEARRIAHEAGFEILRTNYLFVFPKSLAPLRPLETHLASLPLGAQYQVLCRKPG